MILRSVDVAAIETGHPSRVQERLFSGKFGHRGSRSETRSGDKMCLHKPQSDRQFPRWASFVAALLVFSAILTVVLARSLQEPKRRALAAYS